jgi:hypothetical protein
VKSSTLIIGGVVVLAVGGGIYLLTKKGTINGVVKPNPGTKGAAVSWQDQLAVGVTSLGTTIAKDLSTPSPQAVPTGATGYQNLASVDPGTAIPDDVLAPDGSSYSQANS